MMNHWQHSAEILIVHFHAISQRDVPLTIEWKDEDRRAAGMDDRAVAFVKHLKSLAESDSMYSGLLALGGNMQLIHCTSRRPRETSERPTTPTSEMDIGPPSASERSLGLELSRQLRSHGYRIFDCCAPPCLKCVGIESPSSD